MELQVETTILEKGGLEIPKEVTDVLGTELKCINMNDVWLLIASSGDNRFSGEQLPSSGTTYYLPKKQLSALKISSGDMVKFLFSAALKTVILLKMVNAPHER